MGRDWTNKKEISKIFITYANGSFREDPDNIKKLFDVIDQRLPLTFRNPSIEVETICNLIGPNGKEFLAELHKNTIGVDKLREQKQTFIPIKIAHDSKSAKASIDAIYAYQDVECTDCRYHRTLPTNYSYDGQQRVNCLECVQLYFIQVLDSLVKNPKFYRLNHFNRYLNDCAPPLKIRTVHYVHTTKFKQDKRTKIGLGFGYMYDHSVFGEYVKEKTPDKTAFNDFIIDIMYFCLFKFLEHHDRGFIKRCKNCNRFFVSEKLSDRYINCPECIKTDYRPPEKHKERQAEGRKRKKQILAKGKKAVAILSYMDKGFSRSDAEKLYEDDIFVAKSKQKK